MHNGIVFVMTPITLMILMGHLSFVTKLQQPQKPRQLSLLHFLVRLPRSLFNEFLTQVLYFSCYIHINQINKLLNSNKFRGDRSHNEKTPTFELKELPYFIYMRVLRPTSYHLGPT